MKIALITGSSGLVGSESARFFLKKKFKVIGIDNNLRKYFFGKDGDTSWMKRKLTQESKNFISHNVDIRSYKKLENIFKKYKNNIKIIIHAAAQPSHDWAKKEPQTDFAVNANGTLNLLELTRLYCSKSVFIFLSTNKVYGDNPNKIKFVEKKFRYDFPNSSKFKNGIDETMSIDNNIHSLFGVSKSAGDLLVQEYGKNFKIKSCCFRAGCITGPNHSGAKLHGFLSYLVKQVLNKNRYTIIGYKGKQVRDNIHSLDLIKCFWEFYKKPRYGEVYNIGGGKKSNCSILEAINFIKNKTKKKIKIKIIKKPRIGDHICYISNNNKFKNHYKNWSQKYSAKKILEILIAKSRKS